MRCDGENKIPEDPLKRLRGRKFLWHIPDTRPGDSNQSAYLLRWLRALSGICPNMAVDFRLPTNAIRTAKAPPRLPPNGHAVRGAPASCPPTNSQKTSVITAPGRAPASRSRLFPLLNTTYVAIAAGHQRAVSNVSDPRAQAGELCPPAHRPSQQPSDAPQRPAGRQPPGQPGQRYARLPPPWRRLRR